ncbi:hypothetical protein [Geomesophilobacter sediminis]|uniref:Uncharacterized protein n=1 Tax=Geomesophilobacter sediminis TaxID=2798584 RepID=A0A8J7M2A4_9BACT|nr:hypothetical protein [Geomesophilobacter sediminis]MBJ6727418.1 hypothetical protein [Geomesophilobacter sediminis]
MKAYEPAPDFTAKVMKKVYAYEAARVPQLYRLLWSRPLRYLLAGGGTALGILKAAPVF